MLSIHRIERPPTTQTHFITVIWVRNQDEALLYAVSLKLVLPIMHDVPVYDHPVNPLPNAEASCIVVSACDSISHRVSYSSASAQSLHTLRSIREPLLSFGVAAPSESQARLVLHDRITPSGLLSFRVGPPAAVAASSMGSPHSIAPFLYLITLTRYSYLTKGHSQDQLKEQEICWITYSSKIWIVSKTLK